MTNIGPSYEANVAKKLNGCIVSLRATKSSRSEEAIQYASTAVILLDSLFDRLVPTLDTERSAEAEILLSTMRAVFTSIKMGSVAENIDLFGIMDAFHRVPLLLLNKAEQSSAARSDVERRLEHHDAWSDLDALAPLSALSRDRAM